MDRKTRRQYRDPPIREAICEFRIERPPNWSPQWLQKFKANSFVTETYNGAENETSSVSVNMNTPEPGAQDLLFRKRLDRFQFWSSGRESMVALGPEGLSVHEYYPYPGWETYKDRIQHNLLALFQLVPEPIITRIGLRYINRVPASSLVQAQSLTTFDMSCPAGYPEPSFTHNRQEFSLPANCVAIANYGFGIDEKTNNSVLLLDIDVIKEWNAAQKLPLDRLIETLEGIRDDERRLFEASITDAAREIFDGPADTH